ncbi:hypothetical protein FACS189430_06230 [Bacteroidia bacterium]|nr:hypothetical protein FACS189430_06230 [Bacteroidia bacterium]
MRRALRGATPSVDSVKKFQINTGYFKDSVCLGGTLDGFNTRLRAYNFRMQGFEPIKKISLQNNGNNIVRHIRLYANGQNFYTEEGIINQFCNKAKSQKDTAMLLYEFVKNHRIHDYPAALWETDQKYRMFGVWGYGTCDGAALNIGFLARAMGLKKAIPNWAHHVIGQAVFSNTEIMLDADQEVFYLNLENKTGSGLQDVLSDKYLIQRTKHYGKYNSYAKDVDYSVASVLCVDTLFVDVLHSLDTTYPWDGDFFLYPEEKIELHYPAVPFFYQHNSATKPNVNNDLPVSIANPYYLLSSNFRLLFEVCFFSLCKSDGLWDRFP